MFQPDIIVLAPDAPDVMLVAELKWGKIDTTAAERQLRAYMLDNRCHLALLVTPSITWMYRDTLRDFSDASIQRLGEFSTSEILGLAQPATTEGELFQAVREWLERLAATSYVAGASADSSRKPVLEHVVPAVADGRVLSSSFG
jgi:hypothetical protein